MRGTLIILLTLLMGGLAAADQNPTEFSAVWFKSASTRPRAVVLLAHGLNLKPERMNSLAVFLRENGFDSLRVGLSGHDGNLARFKKVTAELWEKEFLEGYQVAAARADEIGVPLYFLGFSLGGALGLDLMNQANSGVSFSRMVLLAPAVSIGATRRLVTVFNIFGRGFCLPSLSPRDYRANPCTPVAAYNSLLQIAKRARESRLANSNVPTLVFIDPQDELVDFGGLKKLVADDGLNSWRISELQKPGDDAAERIHHLIIDEQSLGRELWSSMKAEILSHFSN